MPTILLGYESPASRPVRDETYSHVVTAFNRLMQASATGTISIQEMTAYYDAFALPFRLGWFVDAIQAVQTETMIKPEEKE